MSDTESENIGDGEDNEMSETESENIGDGGNNEKSDKLIMFIGFCFVSLFCVGLVIAEFLIFYNPEARADWGRMMPIAIISPFMFAYAFAMAVGGGLSLVLLIPFYLFKIFRGGEGQGLLMTCFLGVTGLVAGGGVVVYWVQSIVIEKCPAFGYNPYNVYAVAGINTMFLFPVTIIVGVVTGIVAVAVFALLMGFLGGLCALCVLFFRWVFR